MDFDQLAGGLGQPGLRAAAALTLIILVLGRIPILQFLILPFVVFGVIVHEVAHALAAVLTGGQFGSLSVTYDTTRNYVAGATRGIRGGNDLIITNAGYLGTVLFGAALLVVAASEVSARVVLLLLGGGLILLTLLFVRGLFGVVAGLLIGAGLILVSRQLPEVIARGVLWIMAVTMILDTVLDLINTPQDAKDLEKSTRINFGIWIALWWVLVAIIVVYALNRAYGVPLPWTLLER